MRHSRTGFSLLSVLAAITLASLGIYAFLYVSKNSRRSVVQLQDRALAISHASELLEVFATMSNTELNNYLFNNGAKFAAPVPLCEAINYLDRGTGTLSHPDTMAELPPGSPLKRRSGVYAANRFYRVQVVDSTDLNLVQSVDTCGATSAYNFSGASEDHRYRVTVVVSWIREGSEVGETYVSLSTLLPRV